MDNNETIPGLNLLSAGFQDVGYTSINLANLKVTNASGSEVTASACFIDLIDGLGNPLKTYVWASTGRGDNKTWSWKEGQTPVTDVTFARGVGLLFTAEKEGDTLVSAGTVDLSAYTAENTIAGLNVIANPYPTTVAVKELKVTNADGGEVTASACFIDLIDGLGNPLKTYVWASTGRGDNKTWSWKEGQTPIGDDVTIEPGQAVLFTAENAGDKLIFPAKK